MGLDPVLLARIQFAMTVGFHFIFPSISIGLAWLLVIIEGLAWRTGDPVYERMGRYFARFLAITFGLGVATGITMEFQFGMNWAEYSKYVGDIFGAPLAAEAVLFFFLESTFLGLYLFGRGKVSKGAHWFSILLVALGATFSVFWIVVANSWQQTPTGYVFNEASGRAELASFWGAVFNPSTPLRFLHVVDAVLMTGAFFMAGVSAFILLRKKEDEVARRALRIAITVAFIAACAELFPLGHVHAQQVAQYQPEKLAAFEGLYETTDHAPLTLFGIPREDHMALWIRVPGMLSLMVGNSLDTVVRGINSFPPEERPPILIPFASFHLMVGLGTLFIVVSAVGVFLLKRGTLGNNAPYNALLVAMTPLPVLACEMGWMAAEVGRQPWAVYRLLRTQDSVSQIVSANQILFSLFVFGTMYALLGLLFLTLIFREALRGPEEG